MIQFKTKLLNSQSAQKSSSTSHGQKQWKGAISSLLMLGYAGCSVVMAATESEKVDRSSVAPGATRAQVEKVLGSPIEKQRNWSSDSATYQYFTGDEKSYSRAALYTVFDIFTGGFAEFITTPIEALQGDKHVVKVVYDLDGRVISTDHSMTPATLEKPERIIGLESPRTDPNSMQEEPEVVCNPINLTLEK